MIETSVLKAKDFQSDQDVKWCPGCGDYSILKQTQTVMAGLGIPHENIVIISGIGCSSRFPYYMNTYGMHTIHGRAPAFASGLKAANPDLNVWIVTGDGDAMSIGGNHFIHILRRNFDVNILLFNNEIYGLTKGQYSPTSEAHKITKSSPFGSLDHPFNPIALALGSDATFVARSMDRDPHHLQEMLIRANAHQGSSFIEIYQNCKIFNEGTFSSYSEKDSRSTHALYMENGQPLVFGTDHELGIRLDGFKPEIVKLGTNYSLNDLWIHDEHDPVKGMILSRFFDDPNTENALPRPFGIFYVDTQREAYEKMMVKQIDEVRTKKGPGNLNQLLKGKAIWTID